MKKRILALFLSLALCLSLCGCSKSEEAKAVEAQISSIGTVTLESEKSIIEAETAMDALSSEDKETIDNADILKQARQEYDRLVLLSEAEEIDNMITALFPITIDSGYDIFKAQTVYDECAQEIKDLVTGADKLIEAEEELQQLQIIHAENLIDTIGKVTLDSNQAISDAWNYINSLPEGMSEKIGKISVLQNAHTQYLQVRDEYLNSQHSSFNIIEDKFQDAKFYYPKQFPFSKQQNRPIGDERSFVLPYIYTTGVKNNAWTGLRYQYNYLSNNWVFFTKITVLIDGKGYTRTFNYNDVIRETSWGEIYEYIDIEANQEDIAILWKIANSDETIVRFMGDTYYDDVIITEADKKAIETVLTIYEKIKLDIK